MDSLDHTALLAILGLESLFRTVLLQEGQLLGIDGPSTLPTTHIITNIIHHCQLTPDHEPMVK